MFEYPNRFRSIERKVLQWIENLKEGLDSSLISVEVVLWLINSKRSELSVGVSVCRYCHLLASIWYTTSEIIIRFNNLEMMN
jgi:hypothetical protein